MATAPSIPSVGFFGGGKMGGAIIRRILDAGMFEPQQIIVYSPHVSEQLRHLGVRLAQSNVEVLQLAGIVVCAVKPQVVSTVLREVKGHWDETKLLISICAGVPLSAFETAFGGNARIIRSMPTVTCMVGDGSIALCPSKSALEGDVAVASAILEKCGSVYPVLESQLDAVTGLSGSGPAFVCTFIEAMSDAGVKNGLPRELSSKLALETVLGTSLMLKKTNLHPALLKEQAASPGGTTIAGICASEEAGLRYSAVNAATHRSRELGE